MDANKTIALDKAVIVGDITVTELNLREPTGDEVSKFLRASVKAGEEFEAAMLLVSLVAGIAMPVVKRLPVSKIQEASDYLAGFINPGPKTGENSPPI